MLRDSRQTNLSFHSELYSLIPENHQLRKINSVVDFSFVNELVSDSYCKYYGRPANEPELLFRLCFLQILYRLSDAQVVADSQVNLAYKWFLGLNPEDPLPDASQLSRFRKHRLGTKDVSALLEPVVEQCVEKGLLRSKSILVDSTHILANASRETPLQVLQHAAARLYRAVKKKFPKLAKDLPDAPHVSANQDGADKKMLHYLAELGEAVEKVIPEPEGAIAEKLRIARQIVEDERLLAGKGIASAIDPDARLGWKSRTRSYYGYKAHLAMTEEELITAVEVTPGNGGDGPQLQSLIEKTEAAGVQLNEVIADTAYSGKENLEYMKSNEIQPIVPLHPAVHNGLGNLPGFEYNKDADIVTCPAGHQHIRKEKRKNSKGYSGHMSYHFDVRKCQSCPLQAGCYRPGAKTKTYSVRIPTAVYQEHMEFEQTDEFRQRMKRRSCIEHKNAELKRYLGLDRCRYRGLLGMRLQACLTAFVANVKRMVRLTELNQATV